MPEKTLVKDDYPPKKEEKNQYLCIKKCIKRHILLNGPHLVSPSRLKKSLGHIHIFGRISRNFQWTARGRTC